MVTTWISVLLLGPFFLVIGPQVANAQGGLTISWEPSKPPRPPTAEEVAAAERAKVKAAAETKRREALQADARRRATDLKAANAAAERKVWQDGLKERAANLAAIRSDLARRIAEGKEIEAATAKVPDCPPNTPPMERQHCGFDRRNRIIAQLKAAQAARRGETVQGKAASATKQ